MLQVDSLCVCMTPLHVLIAERIVHARGRKFARGLYLCHDDTAKHRFYAERLSAICETTDFKAEVQPVPSGPLRHWHWVRLLRRMRLRLAQQFAGIKVREVVTSCSADRALMALLAVLQPSELSTFDDGFANIDPSPPPIFVHTRWPQRLILQLAGIGWWPERVHQRSARHFTIYDQANVVQRLQRLTLGAEDLAVPAAGDQAASNEEDIVVFLGPYPEVGPEILEAFERAARQLKPIGYLPHPRDAHGLLKSVPRLESLLVAEDFVVQQLRKAGSAGVRVYGYNSSGLVNLAAIQGARAYNFVLSGTAPSPGGRMMEQMGVSLLDF
ncbi:glycosyltransferase family 52 [Herbaspirillum huttiense]|uniref:glycosyltransferase family 52 n=1 Tax=Herbaspirillum huttiense TaxID=863372 RepID=UPI0039AF6F45